MTPQLQWENGKCINAPDGWTIATRPTTDGTCWFWQAHTRQSVHWSSAATESAAKRACEVAMLRLCVLPIGSYWYGPDAADGDTNFNSTYGSLIATTSPDFWAVGRDNGTGTCTDLASGDVGGAEGVALSQVVLRALVADALEREGK